MYNMPPTSARRPVISYALVNPQGICRICLYEGDDIVGVEEYRGLTEDVHFFYKIKVNIGFNMNVKYPYFSHRENATEWQPILSPLRPNRILSCIFIFHYYTNSGSRMVKKFDDEMMALVHLDV